MGCRVLPKGPRLTTSRFAGRLCSGTRRDLAHPLPCRAAGGHGASPERLLCQTDCAALVPECLHRKAQPRPAVNNSLHFCLLLTHQWDNWDNFIPPQHCCKNTARPRGHNQHGNKGVKGQHFSSELRIMMCTCTHTVKHKISIFSPVPSTVWAFSVTCDL